MKMSEPAVARTMIALGDTLYCTSSRDSVPSEASKPSTPPAFTGTPTDTPGSFDQAKR